MEYIPKDKVLELWRYWKFIEAYDQVKAMPGIEIVRCKDCKWRKAKMMPKSVKCLFSGKDDDFCSYGERSRR